MGDEIARRHFVAEDYTRFRRHLDQETALVGSLFEEDGFSHRGDITGFELEAWLVDKAGRPSAANAAFLERLGNPLVVPELAAFNIELNGSPCAMTGRVFTRLHDELAATWKACRQSARAQDLQLAIIGILPTISPDVLNSSSMSNMVRYQALNDRVLALRNGAPVEVDINGADTLRLSHDDVMLEAATTSFQIHLQCKPDLAARTYNAALVASAPMVALAANSPFLFGKSLWAETRIPLFEQAVSVGPRTPRASASAAGTPTRRYSRYSAKTWSNIRSCCPPPAPNRRTSSATFDCTTARSGAGTDRSSVSTSTASPTCASSIASCPRGLP